MTTATVLAAACKKKDWDATDLASHMTVSGDRTSVVSTRQWLAGLAMPSPEKGRTLCELLDLDFNDLYPAAKRARAAAE